MANSLIDSPSEWASPAVLEWARNQAALEPEEVDDGLSLPPGTVKAWERGLEAPSIEALRHLSRIYDVPFSYFFLESPPAEAQISDFRGVPEERRSKLSRQTKLALREFRRMSSLAKTLQEITGNLTTLNLDRFSTGETPEEAAKREAQRIGIDFDLMEKWSSNDEAYEYRRKVIESLGIFVISLALPSRECRGAAIGGNSYATSILVNHNEPPTGRSFTLFHEYCHLVMSADTKVLICDHFPSDTESFSNRFASSILLPEQILIKLLQERDQYHYREWWPDNDLWDLARALFVSRDVVAIRLENLDLAPLGFYRRKRERWDRLYRKPGGFGQGGKSKRTYAREKLGPSMFELALTAVRTGTLPPIDAALSIGEVRTGKKPWVIKAKDIESWRQGHPNV